jgi:hypothetical protein
MGSVNWRKRGNRYQVAWRLDDGSQGAKTVASKDEALDLAAEKRLETSRNPWQGRRRGWLPFGRWADEWWAVVNRSHSQPDDAGGHGDPASTPRATLLRRPPHRGNPALLIRQWQNQLPSKLGYERLMACRSILFRILQLAEDEGAITANPLRRVPPPSAEPTPRGS